jgi:hypothetical protein
MKKSHFCLKLFLILITLLTCGVTFSSGQSYIHTEKTDYSRILLSCSSKEKQVSFGVDEIISEANTRGMIVLQEKKINQALTGTITVNIIADSLLIPGLLKSEGLKPPKYSGWQCYSIRIRNTGNDIEIWVLGSERTGAMYGCLDIAEAIRNNSLNEMTDSDNAPYLERRGIKFNLPLDLRTPSYSDLSDAFQQNIPVVWDLEFWKQQFDEMARNRLNVISLWNLNPFPSMVKVPEFPDVALNDIWRTTARLDASYSLSGSDNLNNYLLENHEIVRKLTINQKIAYWKKVMEYANDRGIEVYLFTWNIFTFGEGGKYGISSNRSNEKTIAYFRASVREMVLTYPLLAGFGITAGENMGGNNEKYTNEQWLWKTYGEGIRDALEKQPQRKIRLIHRFHMTGLSEITKEFKDYPGIVDLSIKYSIAHMYSIPDPPFGIGVFDIMPANQKTWLTVRNDDIYSFRWGNPEYARQYLTSIPHHERVAGFYMGSDGYCWGRDFLSRDTVMSRPLIIRKQWYSFMLWGRLSYNPDLPDELFLQTIKTRFPGISSPDLMNAWSSASMVFPWITRLSWGDIDLKWFPEACLSHPTKYKGFYTVKDFMEVDPEAGSNIRNIIEWAQNYKFNKPDKLLSPLAVADTISKYSKLAFKYLHELPPVKPDSFDEIDQTLGDIEAFATIGLYYAEKIRGACSLALYNFYGIGQDKEDAVDHLTKAVGYWKRYALLYDSKYKPALFNRVGFVNIPSLVTKTEQDIAIARNWKQFDIKEYKRKTTTENPFRK